MRGRLPDAALAGERQNGGVFKKADRGGKALCKAPDVVGRLYQHRHWGVDATQVVVGAGDAAHLRGIERLVPLADLLQRIAEIPSESQAPLSRGRVDFHHGIKGLWERKRVGKGKGGA